ncbi:hypothetical protein [Plantibacter sp. CFBP 8775]|uniref:hypothetical protein n=1 Tax=Plantibacter sp. CFBP 8775 TaxID=2774038 RepID=UPI00177AAAD3|nr:hypothetical protein [Plantibacter sp. CFBP 8775]MBD8101304.1 hypothetical protein [Plantibacter sp. CFBP 8775]
MVDLADILVHEERARRIVWTTEESSEHDFPLTDNSLATQVEGTSLRFRFRMIFADQNAEFVADIEAAYEAEEAVVLTESLTADFASRVAFMAVYPFLRSSIFYSAHRLGLPAPLLAMVKQGEFAVGDNMSPEQVQLTFGHQKSDLSH